MNWNRLVPAMPSVAAKEGFLADRSVLGCVTCSTMFRGVLNYRECGPRGRDFSQVRGETLLFTRAVPRGVEDWSGAEVVRQ